MQTLTPRDGQTNWQMRTFFSTPQSFQFPNVKSIRLDIHWRPVKFSPFAVWSKWPCPLIKFCSARNDFFYCCFLCPHKCKNKCCALKKAVKWNTPNLNLHCVRSHSFLSVYTHHPAWEEFPTGLWISQTYSGLDPAQPKFPLLMRLGSCSVRSLHGRSIAVLKS